MTSIGDLRRRLVLEAPADTDDDAGGVTREYAAVTTLWAAVTPASARGDVVADSAGTTITHRVVIRARDDVTTRHRLRQGDRIYLIVALRDQDDGRFLEIHAEERRD